MESNKLMLNDWVMHDGKPKTVDVLWYGKYVSLNDPQKEYGSIYADKFPEEEISPIPLTLEILQKNGWTIGDPRWYNDIELTWLDGRIGIASTRRITGKRTEPKFSFGGIVLNYVHDLQHMLRTFGIDDNIIV